MPNDRVPPPAPTEQLRTGGSGDDESNEIRYRLTALGEAVLAEDRAADSGVFRGFGPCGAVA